VASVHAKRGALGLLKQAHIYRILGISFAPEHVAFVQPRPFGRGYLFRARPCACARTRSHTFLNDKKMVKCWLLIIVEEKNEQKAKAYFVRF
jgi:hypothetical protein